VSQCCLLRALPRFIYHWIFWCHSGSASQNLIACGIRLEYLCKGTRDSLIVGAMLDLRIFVQNPYFIPPSHRCNARFKNFCPKPIFHPTISPVEKNRFSNLSYIILTYFSLITLYFCLYLFFSPFFCQPLALQTTSKVRTVHLD
jgi:hypothetical protein